MALVVEDGTGKADADSYVSLADANAYAVAHGLTFPIAGADVTPAEQALRRATVWIDATYRGRFSGYRKNRRNQALEWPRVGAMDALYPPNLIKPDVVPVEIVQATIEAAVREKAAPGALSPDITPGKIIGEVSVDGAVSVKYAAPGGVQDQRPVATVIDGILASLLGDRASNLFGSTVRG